MLVISLKAKTENPAAQIRDVKSKSEPVVRMVSRIESSIFPD